MDPWPDPTKGMGPLGRQTVQLPEREAPKRRNESRDLVRPIVVALNRMAGVRVTRNANLGPVIPYEKRFDPGTRPVLAGLGTGSADIVGVVTVWALLGTEESHPGPFRPIGRVFCLEVKLPSLHLDGVTLRRAGSLKADQRRWLETVRRFGGFATVVHSVEEAREAVDRCRAGQNV